MATTRAEENQLTDMKLKVVVDHVSNFDRADASRKRALPRRALGAERAYRLVEGA